MRCFTPLVLTLCLAASAMAQVEEPLCVSKAIPINSGFTNNATLPVGAGDPNWVVISDPDPGTNEPRPAFVINPNVAWKPALANSMWISSYNSSVNPTNGKYVFQNCFCLNDHFTQPAVTLSIRADDQADVFLNGTHIGSTPNPSFNTTNPTNISTSNPSLFKPGRNCLTVELNNTGNVAMGFDLAGTISAAGLNVQTPECCNPNSMIQGRKWNDANGNGVMDSGELPLAGWTVNLSNGMTAVTDSLGFYNFTNVPPGTYTVAESLQAGWQQTFPTGAGTYTITVPPHSVIAGKDFGNRKRGDGEIPACSLCGDFNNSCCLGKDPSGATIYSFLLTITYQPLGSVGSCPLTLTPSAGTVLTYSPQVLVPGVNTVSGTIAVNGTPPSPFCFKLTCAGTAGGNNSCVGAVCTKLLPPCNVK